MKKYLLLWLIIPYVQGSAQEHIASGKIDQTSKKGFYNIFLSPAEAIYLNDHATNARIFDSKNSEVPYILTADNPILYSNQFLEYPLVTNKQIPGKQTILTVHNASKSSIDNICLVIKNASVNKVVRVSGSDNNKQWFVVRDQSSLDLVNTNDNIQHISTIEFPLTNYEYYQLEIADSANAPLNILKAGYFASYQASGKYTAIPDSISVTTDAKEKRTYIQIRFRGKQIVDKLELKMTGSSLFQREGTISTEETYTVKKRTETISRVIGNFTVRSGLTTIVSLDAVVTDNLKLCIENEDNPALAIENFTAYQLNRYLTTLLNDGESYTVAFHVKDTPAPNYDLKHFTDSIPDKPEVLKILNLQAVNAEQAIQTPTFFNNETIIWVAIAAVILFLGFMSLKMVRETGSTKDNS